MCLSIARSDCGTCSRRGEFLYCLPART
jgi:hypothetical protein